MKALVGSLIADGSLIAIEEKVPTAAELATNDIFTLGLKVGDAAVELDIHALRKLKRLICDGEKQLHLRHEQALKSRNLQLDL